MKCHVCEQDDRTPKGKCRVCRDEVARILAQRVAAMGPCARCGASERSPRGQCRPCAREYKRKQREHERSPEVIERKRVLLELLATTMKRNA